MENENYRGAGFINEIVNTVNLLKDPDYNGRLKLLPQVYPRQETQSELTDQDLENLTIWKWNYAATAKFGNAGSKLAFLKWCYRKNPDNFR